MLQFSRTSPYGSVLQRFIQPHDDNYHLLHHILPRIPMSKYKLAHEWLLEHSQEYKNANRKSTINFSIFREYFGRRVLAYTKGRRTQTMTTISMARSLSLARDSLEASVLVNQLKRVASIVTTVLGRYGELVLDWRNAIAEW